MASFEGPPMLRIGELGRRLGISVHVLRAWESRYGLLQPLRSAGGFRLYSEADVLRVRRMQAHLARGLSAAEAARAVLEDDSGARGGAGPAVSPDHVPAPSGELAGALRRALDAFDEPAAQTVLDRLMSDLSLATLLREVVLPYLAELGQRWEQGTTSIAQEHFASNIIRGRLAGLARGWGNGHGPLAVLACPPGELHDLALMVFGIVLNRNGWKIDYLGISTPVEEIVRAVDARQPRLVVVAATLPETLKPLTTQLTMLARRVPLVLAGPAVTPQLAAAVQARLVSGDPVTAAENIGWPLPIPNHQEPS
jgi:DNA-binding transcriptional MerR regulator